MCETRFHQLHKSWCVLCICLVLVGTAQAVSFDWWNSTWHHRLHVPVDTGNTSRTDFPIEVPVNFSAQLNDTFDNASVRVVSYYDNGTVERIVPSQFDESSDYSVGNAEGTVAWTLNGTVPAETTEQFFIYFDSVQEAKSAPSYAVPFNYSRSQGVLYANSSVLRLHIDSNRSERTAGLSFAYRRDDNTEVFDVPSNEKTLEYLFYQNGSQDLGFDLANNFSIQQGPARLVVRQQGPEVEWNSDTETGQAQVTKTYRVYPEKNYLKLRHVYENTAGKTISRSSDLALRLDVDRRGMANTNADNSDPYSWKSAYASSPDRGVGIVNLNESVSNFVATQAFLDAFISIGQELQSMSIGAGNSISETSLLYFNNQSSHSPVERVRDTFAQELNITQNGTESYSVVVNGSVEHGVYNRNETAIVTADIVTDSHDLTSSANVTLNAGTAVTGDDITLPLFDDGTHGDTTANNGVYTNQHTFASNATTGEWNGTVTAYDDTIILNTSEVNFTLTRNLTHNLSIRNPSGIVNRTVNASLTLQNARNDTYIAGAQLSCETNGSTVSDISDLNNGTYSLSFSAPATAGDYQVLCNATWANNSASAQENYSALAATVPIELSLSPNATTVTTITQTTNASFSLNTTANNTGDGPASFVNMSISVPTASVPVNWTDDLTNTSCGNLSAGDSCERNITVTVAEQTVPGIHNVSVNTTWRNLDGSVNQTQSRATVNVTANQQLVVPESSLNDTIAEGNTDSVGNITLNATGNANVSNVSLSCDTTTEVCDNMTVTFSNSSFSQIGAGNAPVVTVNVSVPAGFTQGTFNGTVNVSGAGINASTVHLSVTVPANDGWSLSSQVCSRRKVVNSSGSFCNVSFSAIGNEPVNASITPASANGTTVNVTDFTVPAQESEVIGISYNSTGLAKGFHNATYLVSTNGTPANRTLNTSLDVVIGADVFDNTTNASAQSTPLTLNVTVDDLSGSGISSVEATVMQPDNDQETVDLSNTTQNTPGSISTWVANYTNTTQRGIYQITVNATDTDGGTGTVQFNVSVFAQLQVSLSTPWKDYFAGETASIQYNVTDVTGTPLAANVSLDVAGAENTTLLAENYTTESDGTLPVTPQVTLPSDSERGNYTITATTEYYDSRATMAVEKTQNSVFTTRLPLSLETDTSVVFYKRSSTDTTIKAFVLLSGDTGIAEEVNSSTVALEVFDPDGDSWLQANGSQLEQIDSSTDSRLYLYEETVSQPNTGVHLIETTLTQGSREKRDVQTFRISKGGPFDIVIDSIEPTVSQGTYQNFTIRLENKGDVGLDVFLDYWHTQNNTSYASVESEAVFVPAAGNRSFERELFVQPDQPTGTYRLNARLNYSQLQPILETSRTFQVTEENVTQEAEQPAPSGGGGGDDVEEPVPPVGAAEPPEHSVTITQLFPQQLDIERGGTRYITVEVRNTGDVTLEDMRVEISNIPSSWYGSPTIDTLPVGESDTLLLRLSVPSSVERQEKQARISVISDETHATETAQLRIFQSKAELVRVTIANAREMLRNIENSAQGLDTEQMKRLTELLGQARELLRLAEKHEGEGNLVEALDYATEARNVLTEAKFASVEKAVVERPVQLPFSKLPVYGGLALLGIIASALVVHTVQELHGRHEMRKIKKAVRPQTTQEGIAPPPSPAPPEEASYSATPSPELQKQIEQQHERTSHMLELLQRQHKQGLISDATFMELAEKYKGTASSQQCGRCQLLNEPDAMYCVQCGTQLGSERE